MNEFQFIRKYFHFIDVFSIDERKPIYAVTNKGIEFRCSYILSGYKLEKVGEHLNSIPLLVTAYIGLRSSIENTSIK